MPQKRAARRGSNTTVSGSKDSVELGRNGDLPAKKPSPELVEASQFRKGMAAARDGTTKPPKTATTEPASSRAGEMPSKYSASRRQEGMAKKLPPSEVEGEEKEKESQEELEKEAPGPNPQQPKRKRASGRVTRSQQQRGSEESAEAPSPNPQPKRKRVTRSQQQQRRKEEGAQPSESKKPKSKKITPAPLQQQLSQSEMPKSKKITPAPLQQELSQSEMPKSKKITPAPLQQQGEERAEPSGSETPKSKRIRRIWTPRDEVRILKALVKHRRKEGKLPAWDDKKFFDSIAKRLKDKSCNLTHIKDKVRSMRRRYKSFVAPSTDHEKRLYDLSDRVWGDLPANGSNGDGQQAEGEHAMAEAENGNGQQAEGEHAVAEAENGGGQTLNKSFEEMCEMYPLLGQEVHRLEGVQPALRSSFTRLDGKKALLMEQKLGKLKWEELKIQAEMQAKVEAPKARIRNQLFKFLSKNI